MVSWAPSTGGRAGLQYPRGIYAAQHMPRWAKFSLWKLLHSLVCSWMAMMLFPAEVCDGGAVGNLKYLQLTFGMMHSWLCLGEVYDTENLLVNTDLSTAFRMEIPPSEISWWKSPAGFFLRLLNWTQWVSENVHFLWCCFGVKITLSPAHLNWCYDKAPIILANRACQSAVVYFITESQWFAGRLCSQNTFKSPWKEKNSRWSCSGSWYCLCLVLSCALRLSKLAGLIWKSENTNFVFAWAFFNRKKGGAGKVKN